jgi:glycerol-3-phosphate acyltransferase PlsY
MSAAALAFVGFWLGSIPFSVWLGKLALGKDIRGYGDGNPGATNVFRAGGRKSGMLAVLLDILKGTIPVGISYLGLELRGGEVVLIAIAPVLGHAFSPFLKFQGGKAVAVTFGIWVGLTIWEAPTVLGLMLLYWFRSMRVSGWAVMFALTSLMLYLVLAHPDSTLIVTLLLNMSILAWKHRSDLVQAPGFRPWYRNLRFAWKS